MANLKEASVWELGVYQIEENDPVLGGENGITNLPAKNLANRTVWLKNELTRSVQAINVQLSDLSTAKADKTVNITAGNGLTGGGDLSANRTLTLGTPGKITASTTNSVGTSTHTHEIDNASTTTPGVVKLNDTLSSMSVNEALTANQGRLLNNAIINKSDLKTINWEIDQTSGYTKTGFYRTTSLNSIDGQSLPSFEVHITHPSAAGNAYARGIGFGYGGGFNVMTTAWDENGKYLGYKTVLTELNGVMQSTAITAGDGLTGGGTLASSRTLTLGTPGKITASTTNSVGTSTHTHEIDNASTTTPGVVKLNDTLSSMSTTEALTANQGRVLNNAINTKANASHRHAWSALDSVPALISNPTQITEGDLNSYTTEGFYFCSANAQATAIANTAVDRAFALQIVKSAGITQIFYAYGSSNVFVRSLYLNAWTPWTRLSTVNDNAPSATRLANARTINGVAFDGTQNITITDSTKADKSVNLTAGNGLTGGGDLSANRTLTLGTPGKITASTTNSVGTSTHTHEIDNASTTTPGVVKLNDTLSSMSVNEALTANQGRLLNNAINTKLNSDGTAVAALRLGTARNIALSGTVSGSASFDGSANINIVTSANSSNLRVVSGTGYTITYDDHRRIAVIEMDVWSNASVHSRTTIISGARYLEITLPITLKKRLTASVSLSEVGTMNFNLEAGEWLNFIHPAGYNNTTESKIGVSFIRWCGGEHEAVNCKATIVGIF